jgi:hypothetical protein
MKTFNNLLGAAGYMLFATGAVILLITLTFVLSEILKTLGI